MALSVAALAIADRLDGVFAVGLSLVPFRHFVLRDVLPAAVARHLATLQAPGELLGDNQGRRETCNAKRAFFDRALQDRDPVCRSLAEALQSPGVVALLAARCGAALHGTLLRIEHCCDTDGFWLEPHTDIAAKRLTFLIYLNSPPEGEDWGTDLFDAAGGLAGTAPCLANSALAFVPGADTWHGFRRRRISGTRRVLIVNYVDQGWRSLHELASPSQPVM